MSATLAQGGLQTDDRPGRRKGVGSGNRIGQSRGSRNPGPGPGAGRLDRDQAVGADPPLHRLPVDLPAVGIEPPEAGQGSALLSGDADIRARRGVHHDIAPMHDPDRSPPPDHLSTVRAVNMRLQGSQAQYQLDVSLPRHGAACSRGVVRSRTRGSSPNARRGRDPASAGSRAVRGMTESARVTRLSQYRDARRDRWLK
jgi:hypothetical protein